MIFHFSAMTTTMVGSLLHQPQPILMVNLAAPIDPLMALCSLWHHHSECNQSIIELQSLLSGKPNFTLGLSGKYAREA